MNVDLDASGVGASRLAVGALVLIEAVHRSIFIYMRQRALFVAALVTACGVAACSSGGTVTPPTTSGGGGGSTVNNVISISPGGSSTSASFTTQNGLAGTLTVPAGTGKGQIAFTTSPASGFVVVQNAGKRPATAPIVNTPIFYETITAVGGSLTLNNLPGESVTLTTAPVNPVYEAQGTLNGTYTSWSTVGGPYSASGTTLTIPAIAGSVTIPSGASLYLAVYQGGTISPSPQPIAVGNTATYAGTLTQSTVYTYPTGAPTAIPSVVPSGMPPLNASATVTTALTVQAAPTPFFAASGTADFNTVETDAYALHSNVLTTDAWYATTASAFQLFGSSVNDGAGDTVTTQYAAPLTVDQLPELGGGAWSNSPAATIVETDLDGTHSTRTYAANGTYTETQTVPNNLTAIIAVNADGSGTYSGTAFSTFRRNNGFSFSTPSPTGVITVATVPTPKPTGTPAPPTTVATPGVWYPVPFVPYTETDTMTTNKPIDSSCALSPSFGATGNDVSQSIQRVDPVLGYVETETTDTYYVAGIGSVCVVLADTQNYYYNYNNDDGTLASAAAVFGTGSLKSTQTTNEVVSLQSTTGIQPTTSGPRAQNSVTGSAALSPIAVAYTFAQFDARLAIVRRAHANAMRSYFDRVMKNLEVAQ
jgi:hypothetical protein